MSNRLVLPFALFMAPLLFLLFALFETHQRAINTARNELSGIPAIVSALRMSQTLLSIDQDITADQRRTLVQNSEDVSHQTRTWHRHHLTAQPVARAKTEIDALLKRANISTEDVREALDALMAVVRAVADSSELILDPDLDSYYLMDTLAVQYPVVLNTLLDIKRDAFSAREKGAALDAFNERKLAHAQILMSTTARLAATFTSVLQHASVEIAIRAFKLEAMRHEAALGAASQHLMQPHNPEKLQELLSNVMHSGGIVRELAATELARLLGKRIDRHSDRRDEQIIISIVLFLMAAAVLLLLTTRFVVRPTKRLTAAMLSLADGNLGTHIPRTRQQDEIGAMSRAVNVFKDNALRNRFLEEERIKAAGELAKVAATLERAEEIASLGHWSHHSGDGPSWQWSSNLFAIAGTAPQAGTPKLRQILRHVVPSDRKKFLIYFRQNFSLTTAGNLTFRYRHPVLGKRHMLSVTAFEGSEESAPTGIIGVVQDITVAKTTESSLVARSLALAEAQEIGRIGDWSYKMGASHVVWAPEIFRLMRYDAATFDTTREAIMALYLGDGAERVLRSQSDVMRTGKQASVDVTAQLGDGTKADFTVTTRGEFDSRGRLTGFLGTIQDISERKLAERELEKLAYYDPLTGLANRALFQRTLRRQLMECQELFQTSALLLLDLDRFKEVNDSLGHAAGDELLVKVAEMLRRELPTLAHLARLGGDEFAIILPGVNAEEAARMADIIIARIAMPVHLRTGEVQIGTSIGIAMMPADGAQRDVLLRHADLALYNAKDAGRMCHRPFTSELSEVVQEKTALARDLRRALLAEDELFVVYQPQVDVQHGRVTGFEALLRWRHPERGLVPPNDFVPIAESSSLISEIGLYVLTASCRQMKAWLDLGYPRRDVAVNVSASQIWHSDFEHDVRRILQETGLPPELLTLEVTESVFLREAEGRVRQALIALKSLGVKLALDDFGTGYSSLGYLNRLPFDKLKIDRCFIKAVHLNPERLKLLKGIVELGQGLGMTTVAEGAEVMDEVRVLRSLNCDAVQGYVFSHPLESDSALRASAMLDLMVPSRDVWSRTSTQAAA